MTLTDDLLREFLAAWIKVYGGPISLEYARGCGLELLALAEAANRWPVASPRQQATSADLLLDTE